MPRVVVVELLAPLLLLGLGQQQQPAVPPALGGGPEDVAAFLYWPNETVQAWAYGCALEETTPEKSSGVETDQDDAGATASTTLLQLQDPVENVGSNKLDSGPRLPYDDQPAGPPERMCAICGTTWKGEKDQRSPCGHISPEGIQTIEAQPLTVLKPKVKVEYRKRTDKWQPQ